jgi:hypothetical protein
MPWVSKTEARKLNIPKKTLQTIELKKTKFTLAKAKKWLKDNNYANAYIRPTTNYYRAMQTPPIIEASYYSKPIDDGNIILVFQEY